MFIKRTRSVQGDREYGAVLLVQGERVPAARAPGRPRKDARVATRVVHRTLARYLDGDRAWVPNDPAVEVLSRHVNVRARNAARAETDRQRMLAAQYMAGHVGEVFPARITRVRPFGLITQLDGSLIEGTLPLDALPEGLAPAIGWLERRFGVKPDDLREGMNSLLSSMFSSPLWWI